MNYRKWTQTDKDFIVNNSQIMGDKELAIKLSELTNSSVTVAMIRVQRRKLGLLKPKGRRKKDQTVCENTV